jgi:hypothetical protein
MFNYIDHDIKIESLEFHIILVYFLYFSKILVNNV